MNNAEILYYCFCLFCQRLSQNVYLKNLQLFLVEVTVIERRMVFLNNLFVDF